MGPDGFDDPKSKFFPTSEQSLAWFETYEEKLKCVDDKIEVSGGFQSDEVNHFSV